MKESGVKTDELPPIKCSFCGKSPAAGKKLIAGDDAFICDVCVDLCRDIIAEECPTPAASDGSRDAAEQDVTVSTLRRCVKALGVRCEITLILHDGTRIALTELARL